MLDWYSIVLIFSSERHTVLTPWNTLQGRITEAEYKISDALIISCNAFCSTVQIKQCPSYQERGKANTQQSVANICCVHSHCLFVFTVCAFLRTHHYGVQVLHKHWWVYIPNIPAWQGIIRIPVLLEEDQGTGNWWDSPEITQEYNPQSLIKAEWSSTVS